MLDSRGQLLPVKVMAGLLSLHLSIYEVAWCDNQGFAPSLQRRARIANAEKTVLEHIGPHVTSVEFHKVRYFEHYNSVRGRRTLMAVVICGELKMARQQSVRHSPFLSWVFVDSETRRYSKDSYVVAIHDGTDPRNNLYRHYHSIICAHSEDGAALKARINLSAYE